MLIEKLGKEQWALACLELDIETYKEHYPPEDMERVMSEEPLTPDELERIDFLVDTLELTELKRYMVNQYGAVYRQMIAGLESEDLDSESLRRMHEKYQGWKKA